MEDKQSQILVVRPWILVNRRIEMVVPPATRTSPPVLIASRSLLPFAALLSHASCQFLGDQTPMPRAVIANELDHPPVLLIRPRSLGNRRVEETFPPMLTLRIGAAIAHVSGNARPIDHSLVRVDKLAQTVILLRKSATRIERVRMRPTSSFVHFR